MAAAVVSLTAAIGLAACSGDDDPAVARPSPSDPATTTSGAPIEMSGDGPIDATSIGSTAPVTAEEGLGEGWAPERRGRTALRGFGEAVVTITDESGETCEVCLLTATTAEQRERGLMEVTDRDLGGYDGMLFEYPDEITGGFWMRNTPMPLSIAYFGQDRALVSSTDMTPCRDEPTCPSYPADNPFRYALEVPKGELDALLVADGTAFKIDARTCPQAAAAS